MSTMDSGRDMSSAWTGWIGFRGDHAGVYRRDHVLRRADRDHPGQLLRRHPAAGLRVRRLDMGLDHDVLGESCCSSPRSGSRRRAVGPAGSRSSSSSSTCWPSSAAWATPGITLWSLTIVTLEIVVLYALTVRWKECLHASSNASKADDGAGPRVRAGLASGPRRYVRCPACSH